MHQIYLLSALLLQSSEDFGDQISLFVKLPARSHGLLWLPTSPLEANAVSTI